MKSGGQIPWNGITICRMSKTSWQTGNLKMNEDLVNHSKDQLYYLTHWLDISQNSERWKARILQFAKKLLPGICLGYALIAGEFGKKNSDCRYWRFGKVRCIRNISQKTKCERSLDNPKRWRICISYGRWFSKIIRKKLRIPRTHSETGIHRKERISAENLMEIGKSFNLKK